MYNPHNETHDRIIELAVEAKQNEFYEALEKLAPLLKTDDDKDDSYIEFLASAGDLHMIIVDEKGVFGGLVGIDDLEFEFNNVSPYANASEIVSGIYEQIEHNIWKWGWENADEIIESVLTCY